VKTGTSSRPGTSHYVVLTPRGTGIYLHRKIRAGETADLVNVLINKAKYIWWFNV
jgi:hypothetical protein